MHQAIALLSGDSNVTGKVIFTQQNENDPTTVEATFVNLPAGAHGFHIHEFGDLSNGCTSAGAHYNPHGTRHGGPGFKERHVGDMGNVTSMGDEITAFVITDNSISLIGLYSVVGRSCVIHRDEDDLGLGDHDDSKTTGHSGPRLACGIIGIMNSST
jgi:Cu-Zn family superoxide dismutase